MEFEIVKCAKTFMVTVGSLLAQQGCVVQEGDWSMKESFEAGAICDVSPIDMLQDDFDKRINDIEDVLGDNFSSFDPENVFVSVRMDFEEGMYEVGGYTDDLITVGLSWAPEMVVEGVAVFDKDGDSSTSSMEVRGGYFCSDGTFVYDLAKITKQLLIVGQINFNLDEEDVRYFEEPLGFVTVYENCPYDSSVSMFDYEDMCDVVMESSDLRGNWSIIVDGM